MGGSGDFTGVIYAHLPGEATLATGGIDNPGSGNLMLTGRVSVTNAMGFIVFGKRHIHMLRTGDTLVVGIIAVAAKQLAFKLIAVELVTGNIGKGTNISLTVIFDAVIAGTGRFPQETQVVLHQMFVK